MKQYRKYSKQIKRILFLTAALNSFSALADYKPSCYKPYTYRDPHYVDCRPIDCPPQDKCCQQQPTACNCLWGWYDGLSPSIGVDLKVTHFGGRRDWHQQFPKVYPGANIYVDVRFHQFVSVELGYEQSTRLVKSNNFDAKTPFFGFNLDGFAYTRRIDLKMPHLDINFHSCMMSNIEFLASFGIGFLFVDMRQTQVKGPNDPTRSFITNSIVDMRTENRPVPRARLGAMVYLSPNIGVRALVGVDGTSQVRVKGNPYIVFSNNNVAVKLFQDSFYASLGLFLRFG